MKQPGVLVFYSFVVHVTLVQYHDSVTSVSSPRMQINLCSVGTRLYIKRLTRMVDSSGHSYHQKYD